MTEQPHNVLVEKYRPSFEFMWIYGRQIHQHALYDILFSFTCLPTQFKISSFTSFIYPLKHFVFHSFFAHSLIHSSLFVYLPLFTRTFFPHLFSFWFTPLHFALCDRICFLFFLFLIRHFDAHCQ